MCLAEGRSVLKAAENAGFSNWTAYQKKKQDPEFSAAWDEAREQASERRTLVPDNQYVPVSDKALCIFLACLSEGWSVSKASERAGFSYATAYVHRRKNPEFSAAWDDAIEQGTDHLEDIATARATEGVQRPIYVSGRLVGHVTEFSDGLLQFMLRGRRREKYGGNGNSSTAALVLSNPT
jgi:hypothetical protein